MMLGSTIILADVTHHSQSDIVAPFVGLTRPQPPLVSPRAVERRDDVTSQAEHVTIVGTGVWLESKDLIGGTGPLFSFGVTEQDFSCGSIISCHPLGNMSGGKHSCEHDLLFFLPSWKAAVWE
ncbi:hypothetical protein BLNAU_19067 [Blattamonas nauphoetae]|uniref:Uncharacterized protein n=1 Tax=Blattamonas nauphoetae TaxID=2049346 RepID=A0ABQ9X2I6_9EUKA|nr:hypothetical protein BLNAU_19067 [Blattamonas nauphoetae]